MKTLLVLGARRMQVPAIRVARDRGLRVVTADPQQDAPGFAFADVSQVCDLAAVDQCLDLARRQRVDGVMTLAAEYPLLMVARISAALSLRGLSVEAALRTRNKHLMRRHLTAAGVPCPSSLQATSLPEAEAVVQRLGAPVILKPTIGHGGKGVTRLPHHATASQIQSAYLRAMGASRGEGILVEEFIAGPEFSVEALTCAGDTQVVAVTDKLTSGDPYWVEIGHSQPARWSRDVVEAVSRTAGAAVAALGIDWSASHTEIRLSPRGPYVVEVAARLGGGFIASHLVPLSSGVDLVGAAIALALGEPLDIRHTCSAGAAIRFITAPPGRVARVTGTEAARVSRGVCEAEVYVTPGDAVPPLADAEGRLGHVIARGEDAQAAVENATRALRCIEVVTTAASAPLPARRGPAAQTLHVYVTCDVDPDGANVTADRTRVTWHGLQEIPALADLLASLGIPATFFVRCDNQIEDLYGSYTALYEEHRDLWQALMASGNEIGWHPHLYERTGATYVPLRRPAECVRTLQAAWNALCACGYAARSVRLGEAWHSAATMRAVDALGLAVDSTAVPGRVRDDAMRAFDWGPTPNGPYHPSGADYRVPGVHDPLRILEVPMSTAAIRTAYDTVPVRRYINPTYHPDLFRAAVDGFLGAPDATRARHMVVIVHPDELLPRAPNGLHTFGWERFRQNIDYLLSAVTGPRLTTTFACLREAAA